MVLETREIPALIFWIAILGLSVYVTSKVIKQVGEEVSKVFG